MTSVPSNSGTAAWIISTSAFDGMDARVVADAVAPRDPQRVGPKEVAETDHARIGVSLQTSQEADANASSAVRGPCLTESDTSGVRWRRQPECRSAGLWCVRARIVAGVERRSSAISCPLFRLIGGGKRSLRWASRCASASAPERGRLSLPPSAAGPTAPSAIQAGVIAAIIPSGASRLLA